MKLQDCYLDSEINLKTYEIWSRTLPNNRMLVPYKICKALGLLNEIKEPSAIFEYVTNPYAVSKQLETPIIHYRSLFDMKKFEHLYIEDTEYGDNGYATEDELEFISALANTKFDYHQYPVAGYTFKSLGNEKGKDDLLYFQDIDGYELVYDVRKVPAYREYIKRQGKIIARKYHRSEVIESRKEYRDDKEISALESEFRYYAPEYVCGEFGILEDYDGPDIYNIEPFGGKFYGLYNVNGKIPYFKYEEAKEYGYWTFEDAVFLMPMMELHNYPIVGYTHHWPIEEYKEEATSIKQIVHLVYDLSESEKFKRYNIKKYFTLKDDLF